MGERSLAEIRRVALGGAGRLSFPADMETLAKALDAAEARVKRMEEALAPFALVAEHDIGESESDEDLFRPMSGRHNHAPLLTVGNFRRAALAKEEGGR